MAEIEKAVAKIYDEFKDFDEINENTLVVVCTNAMLLIEQYFKTESGGFKERVCLALMAKLIKERIKDRDVQMALLNFNRTVMPTMISRICAMSKEGFKKFETTCCG